MLTERISDNYDAITQNIDILRKFHGHIGPYLIIGAKIAIISNDILGDDPFKKTVIVRTGVKPPQSCVVDGIQFFSGCTLGKGNIQLINDTELRAIFSLGEEKLSINLIKPPNIPKGARDSELEKIGLGLVKRKASELFRMQIIKI